MIDTSALDRHEKIALSFSGGKDSLACVYLLRPHMERITIYHMDTGDLLPETREVVEHVKGFWPRFVHIQGDVNGWIAKHGLPTDLVPHGSHPVGRAMGEPGGSLVPRYDCCYLNLMRPTYERIKADGNTLLIRGTKAADMVHLPTRNGQTVDGIEIMMPLENWPHERVFDYLRSEGAPISRIYDYVTNSPECARCSAWWGEKRAEYLKQFHPHLWRDYADRLRFVAKQIDGPLANIRNELAACDNVDAPMLPLEALEIATQEGLKRGVRIMQGNRLAATDADHVACLLKMMAPPRNAEIVDIGCGIGEVARLMHEQRPDLSFVLLNRSPSQLAEVPTQEGLRPVLGDMHAMPVPNASVDGAMFNYAICHGDMPIALREAARVTRPGGFLFVYDYERLSGDNAVMERRLSARAYPRSHFARSAEAAGWRPVMACAPGGDDRLFRSLFDDQAEYDAIFSHLRPVVWRMERVA